MKLPKKKRIASVGIKSDDAHWRDNWEYSNGGIYGDPDRDLIVFVEYRLPYYKAHRLYQKLSDMLGKRSS
jgi:hypothetical protein